MLPKDSRDLHIHVLCGGNPARLATMKYRLKDFPNVTFFDNTGFSCTQGHVRMLEKALASPEIEYLCILEDDACLYKCFDDVYTKVVDFLNTNKYWDMFFFGGNILKPPLKVTQNIYMAAQCGLYTTHAYIIPRRTFDIALNMLQTWMYMYIVDDIYTRSNMTLLLANPMAVTQLAPDGTVEENMLVHNILTKGYDTHILLKRV
jgi:GR25 family glycosyltransferase involved in LPS biosynthesis